MLNSRSALWFVATITVASIVVTAMPAVSQVKMTTKKALALAFPRCRIERRTITLTTLQQRAISKLCGRKFQKSMVFAYIAHRGKKLIGTAWFDVHKVRSKKQLLMVVVSPQQTVDRVEVLAFSEPRKYAVPKRWLDKLKHRGSGQIHAGRNVPRITGATLTVRATTRCVDRILALHQTVFKKPKAPAKDKKR